jgi:hypothetical protein
MGVSILTIADQNLNELLRQLPGRDRESVEELIRGHRTDEAAVVLRWLRKKLKHKVRGKKRRR